MKASSSKVYLRDSNTSRVYIKILIGKVIINRLKQLVGKDTRIFLIVCFFFIVKFPLFLPEGDHWEKVRYGT